MQTICVILRAGERVSNMITYISEWSRSFGNVIVRRTRKTVLVLKKRIIALGSNRNYPAISVTTNPFSGFGNAQAWSEFTGIIRYRIHFLIINRVCYILFHFPICHLWWTTDTSKTMYMLLLFCVFAHWNISEDLNIYTSANWFISVTFSTLFAKRTWLPDFELYEEM